MKKRFIYGAIATLLSITMVACGSNNAPSKSSSEPASSSDAGPKKDIEVTNITLSSSNDKAYITVTGKQTNYTAEDFTWAWGIMGDDSEFADGKATPSAEDFKPASFNSANQFNLKYCLSDITTLKSGVLYTIFGGTPEKYRSIDFTTNNYSAQDLTRRYYLRKDQGNALTFDCIQPISFTKASVVDVAQADLPDGVTNPGVYLKFGGVNSKNITMDIINGWHTAGHIAGNFQRVIVSEGDAWSSHAHTDEERFWKIEGNDVFFYCYIGFVEEGEGWMTHFDLVEGNANANLQFDSIISGQSYTAGGANYKVYADRNNGGSEENYWGCLGVYRVPSNA